MNDANCLYAGSTSVFTAAVIASASRFLSASEKSAGIFLIGIRNGFAAMIPAHCAGIFSATNLTMTR